ncbi:hypothetical protein JVU11DRAFT_4882 [Chiua virens]|nr:hypothetical protein JVU11DRAFT_4882 [Chiua virens]
MRASDGSPLPLGEQLHWSLQLRSFYSFLVLRGSHMHLPPLYGDTEGHGYDGEEIFPLPVILAVGAFSLYHFHSLMRNATTIEGWEKDRAAILKRNGKIKEIKFPYDLGVKRNIVSILGSNPLLWCCPTVPPGTGLKYQLSLGSEYDVEQWPPRDPALDSQKQFKLPDSPWTYENGDVNPALRPSNTRPRPIEERSSSRAYTSALPPYHPDFDMEPEEEYQGLKTRRGSEGYEVRPINREEMLRQYIQDEVETTGRYRLYQPDSEDVPDDEGPLYSPSAGPA